MNSSENNIRKLTLLNPNTKVTIGDRVTLGERITIGRNTSSLTIGYGCFLGNDLYIDVPEVYIGEYTTIHHSTTLHGYKHISIGSNVWIGQFCIIDGIGGASIGNNVGIGAHSQLWSHLKFGDITAGCRWNSSKNLTVQDDVWFVGHCIVCPITAERKSMLMIGGVITQDMKENHVYGGVPAKDMTDKLGPQFREDITLDERLEIFNGVLQEYQKRGNDISFIRIKERDGNDVDAGRSTLFSLLDRTYVPDRSEQEFHLMKYLLYEKGKFLPVASL